MITGLFGVADEYWSVVTARFYQIDLLEMPLFKFLDLIDGWLREILPSEEYEKMMVRMTAPIPGQKRAISDASAQAEGEAFMAVMNMTKGTG